MTSIRLGRWEAPAGRRIHGIGSGRHETEHSAVVDELWANLAGAVVAAGEMEMAVGMRDAQHLGGWSVMGDEPGEDISDAIQWARDA